ncbi:hypothetical protein [Pectobacterium parmentieri]|uniref:hypothetical protein n=1 Tax=Pectobacterium parmentieri TaxID=1905730 RepID=UPI000EB50A57|nr:hypothetical protein [Pectobacterium parmentieri]AYH32960.1 hypothetical protein C5E19_15795 [Pectobacterium parmentieri]
MSLLEAFYYTFAADASPLERALRDAERRSEELRDSVSETDGATQKLGTSFISLAKSAAGLLGVTMGLAGAKALAITAAETTSALGTQARQMNVNVSTLDTWRKAITESGGDADAFTGTMKNLAQRFRDPEAALLRYSKTLGGMSSFRAQRMGAMVGLDEGTIELLRKGKIGVEELLKKQREQGVITKEQVEQSDRFNQKLRTLKMQFDGMKMQLGTALIPIFEKLLDSWNKVSAWVSENQDAVTHFFIALGGIIAAVYLPAMIQAAIATIAATWPILLIAAAFGALALVIADVIGYFNGMDSVTGDLVKQFPALGQVLEALKEIVIGLWDALVMLFTDPIQFLEGLKNEIKSLFDALLWEGAGDTIFDFISDAGQGLALLWQGLEKIILGVVGVALKGFAKIGDAWKTIKGWFGAGKEEVKQAEIAASKQPRQGWEDAPADPTYGGQSQLKTIDGNPINAMTSNSITNSNRNESRKTEVRIDNIEVKTQATDSQGIANSIGGDLQGSISHYDDGFAA